MHRLIGVRNRLGLVVLGLVLLAAALLVGLLASPLRPDVLAGTPLEAAAGVALPDSSASLPDLAAAPDVVWLPIGVGVAGLLLGLLGVAWLLAQWPRTDRAKPLRLHGDPAAGTTLVDESVIAHAVEAQVNALPGVTGARALLRGTARAPELTVRLTVEDRADISALVVAVRDRVAADLATSLETTLVHLAVQVDVGGTRTSSSSAVL